MPLPRRSFLRATAIGGTLFGLEGLVACGRPAPARRPEGGGYGPLVPTPSSNTGERILALPDGFAYTVFGRTGDPMDDGHATPPDHDGMAAVGAGSRIRLVRNHESTATGPVDGRAIGDPALAYDGRAPGGTTTLVIDPATRLPVAHFVSLGGTSTNCAGGVTPWGSWVTCEETTIGPGAGVLQPHGYCFEVPAGADAQVAAVPLRALGRFVHEAIAVDPATGTVYLTEDARASGFYRFLPATRDRLAEGGRLQMLAVRDRPGFDTRTGQARERPLAARWVDIADPDPADAEANRAAVYQQGAAGGGAAFGRLEGCWFGDGAVFFNATSGGDAGLGQVWRYQPQGTDGGTLTLLFESPGPEVLQSPDNICVTPRGGLVLCEDGEGENYVRGLTPDGQIFDFARNLLPENGEFAGACFSPDGTTMFLNIQRPGLTLAIWGEWGRGAL